jgi:hypothetical protein
MWWHELEEGMEEQTLTARRQMEIKTALGKSSGICSNLNTSC